LLTFCLLIDVCIVCIRSSLIFGLILLYSIPMSQ
jgi:hypothetical protein